MGKNLETTLLAACAASTAALHSGFGDGLVTVEVYAPSSAKTPWNALANVPAYGATPANVPAELAALLDTLPPGWWWDVTPGSYRNFPGV